jgi:hypothetical protein
MKQFMNEWDEWQIKNPGEKVKGIFTNCFFISNNKSRFLP